MQQREFDEWLALCEAIELHAQKAHRAFRKGDDDTAHENLAHALRKLSEQQAHIVPPQR